MLVMFKMYSGLVIENGIVVMIVCMFVKMVLELIVCEYELVIKVNVLFFEVEVCFVDLFCVV